MGADDGITNPGTVYSESIITVCGSGDITLMAGMSIIELEGISGSITLDTQLMEAYSDTSSLGRCMSGEFPTLVSEANTISWSGSVSKLTIQPNWRMR